MESVNDKDNRTKILGLILVIGILVGGLSGFFFGYYLFSSQNTNIQSQLEVLNEQISEISIETAITTENISGVIGDLEENLSVLSDRLSTLNQEVDNSDQDLTGALNEISGLEGQIMTIKTQINALENLLDSTIQDISSIPGAGVPLSSLFEQVRESVVVIQALVQQPIGYASVQGSGFVYDYNENMVILTNNHVVEDAVSITVTFTSEDTYDATLIGSNPDNDFAILSTQAPQENYEPLEIISSSTLKVGHSVIVVGTPFGLDGSLSNGIVSSLSRTIVVDGIILSDIIQTTTPLNPGNSGGPLMNLNGEVVGIATAIVEESQGIGFAVPSDTFLNDIESILGS